MSRLRSLIPVLLAIIFLIIAVWGISTELRHYHPQQIWQSLANISKTRKLTAIALTFCGYISMTGYDWLGFRYVRHYLPLGKIVQTSFISYAVGNTVGFTLFSGSAIRYHFYSAWGISKIDIAKIIAFTHLSFWLGMLTVGGIVFLVDPLTFPDILNLPFDSVHPLGIIFLLILAVYIGFTSRRSQPVQIHGKEFAIPSTDLSVGLMVFSALDWALAAGVLYLLLPSELSWSYPGFFGIYMLALTAGIISNVPGGLGVFEAVILFLRPDTVSATSMLGALLAYRGVYYFLPLIVALLLFAFHELKRHYRS
jgi:uncharacterized membrane protein YbhN (UPF0104 family)